MHHQSQHQPGRIQGSSESRGSQPTGATGGPRFRTRNYLSEEVRQRSCWHLNRLLADTTALRMAARYAHWNVRGPSFYQLHELFEEMAETFAEQEDLIAERITALGGQAKGTLGETARTANVDDIPAETTTGRRFVRELADRLAAHDAHLYADLREIESRGDLDTADLLNEVSREVSEQLWFLEAHLQGQPEKGSWGASQPQ